MVISKNNKVANRLRRNWPGPYNFVAVQHDFDFRVCAGLFKPKALVRAQFRVGFLEWVCAASS
jgi:hypothetical protein